MHIHAFNLPPRHDQVHPVIEQYQLLGQTYYPLLSKHHRVSTGRLVEKKGLEYSIRAIARIMQHHPNIRYTIIGDGPLKPDLQQLIEELALSQQVSLLGWRKQEEVIKILDRSQILVAPSVTAADGNQDAPVNTLKEAMAMGLPVIGTLHGGIPELIEDAVSGFLVPERNPEAISEKLSYLIEHPEIWVPMGQTGRAYVEKHYDMHKLNDELVDIYQQLLYSAHSPSSKQPVS